MQPILYVHDLDGSPVDPLAQRLRRAKAEVAAPDGRFRTLTARVADVRAAIAAHPKSVVVGIGFGALAACAAAVAEPRAVQALVLLSPALTWSEPSVFDADTVVLPAGLRVVVVHGTEDAVTPLAASRALVARFPSAELVVVNDVADLRGSLDDIVKRVRTLAHSPVPAAPAKPKVKEAVRKAEPKPKPKPRVKPKLPPKAKKPKASAAKKKPSSAARPRTPVVFAHDLDRGRAEAPAALLYRWNPVVPDGFGKGLARRVEDLQAALDAAGPCIIGGAGYGAVAAMVVAARFPRRVRGLLLLGPSLDVVEGDFDARRMTVPAGVPATIVIGTRDLVASLDDARALQARCPHVQIVTPEDSHDLAASGPAVVGALQDLELAQRKAAPAPKE